jgi:hypothetical protein
LWLKTMNAQSIAAPTIPVLPAALLALTPLDSTADTRSKVPTKPPLGLRLPILRPVVSEFYDSGDCRLSTSRSRLLDRVADLCCGTGNSFCRLSNVSKAPLHAPATHSRHTPATPPPAMQAYSTLAGGMVRLVHCTSRCCQCTPHVQHSGGPCSAPAHTRACTDCSSPMCGSGTESTPSRRPTRMSRILPTRLVAT